MLELLACAFGERKILLHSSTLALLPSISEGLCALLYPLQWPHPCIPVLPRALMEMLEAPQPFILGIDSCWLAHASEHMPEDLVLVDCDLGAVDLRGGAPPPTLP